MIKVASLFLIFSLTTLILKAQTNVYLLPGQGSDYRLFQEIKLDSNYKIHYINYPVPDKNSSLTAYSKVVAAQIDTSKKFILIGTSLGGMLCTEMADYLKPEKVIIISSAKSIKELPFRYRFQKRVPLYKMMPPGAIKLGAKLLQPIVEPDRNKCKSTFKKMLNGKNKIFMKRSVEMIINWDREFYSDKIIHIHGDNDKTIPLRNVKYNYKISGGSHMITLTKGLEINNLLVKILRQE